MKQISTFNHHRLFVESLPQAINFAKTNLEKGSFRQPRTGSIRSKEKSYGAEESKVRHATNSILTFNQNKMKTPSESIDDIND